MTLVISRENLRPGLNGIVTIHFLRTLGFKIREGENLRPGLNGIVTPHLTAHVGASAPNRENLRPGLNGIVTLFGKIFPKNLHDLWKSETGFKRDCDLQLIYFDHLSPRKSENLRPGLNGIVTSMNCFYQPNSLVSENLRPGLNGIVTICTSREIQDLIWIGENLRPGLNGIVTPESRIRGFHCQDKWKSETGFKRDCDISFSNFSNASSLVKIWDRV